jgi:hypothetical protein
MYRLPLAAKKLKQKQWTITSNLHKKGFKANCFEASYLLVGLNGLEPLASSMSN